MAFTPTLRFAGPDLYITDVAIDAGEVGAYNVAHGLGAVPLDVEITALQIGTSLPVVWASTIDATNIGIQKSGAGAANTETTVKVRVARPHSISR